MGTEFENRQALNNKTMVYTFQAQSLKNYTADHPGGGTTTNKTLTEIGVLVPMVNGIQSAEEPNEPKEPKPPACAFKV